MVARLHLVCAALFLPGLAAQQDLQDALAAVVDGLDPAARRAAADALAARSDVTLEQLRGAMAAFGTFAKQPAGTSMVTVELFVGEGMEKTRLHIYVPPNYDPKQAAPLLLAGHGTGGNGRQMLPMWTGIAAQVGMLVVAPSEAGPNGGWAFSVRERESARSAIRYMRRRFHVDENRIFGTGVSRGGHMSWDLALRYPDLFAAIAPMIGGPRLKRAKGQNNLRYLENVTHLPIRDLQGSKDDRYLVANVRLAFRRLAELQAKDAKLLEFPDLGHSFEMGAVAWPEFFRTHARDPRPKKVVRMMATAREPRAFWAEILLHDAKKAPVYPAFRMTAKFAKLDELGQREYIARQIEKATARLQVEQPAVGTFVARSRHVKRFRILLTPEMFEAGKRVVIKHKGRNRRIAVKPSKQVLCREFAERFDRTFLPVAEAVVR